MYFFGASELEITNADQKSNVELLQKFLLNNKELEELEEIINDFNVFTALGVVREELRHSTFLAWLLNPSDTHGLGDYFLKSFLKLAINRANLQSPSIFEMDSWDLGETNVQTEWEHIDIFMRNDMHQFVCVIENKIDSPEHSNQLTRYKELVERELGNHAKIFVYLTIEGDKPSESTEYLSMNYRDIDGLVSQLLERKRDKTSSEIIMFIEHYREMVRRYIVKESRVQDLCQKIYESHPKAIDLILEHKPDKQAVIRDTLKTLIESDPTFNRDKVSKSLIYFMPRSIDFIPKEGTELDSKRILYVEIYNVKERLDLNIIIGPGPQHIREKVYEIAKGNPKVFKGMTAKLYDTYTKIYKMSLLTRDQIENSDIKEIAKHLQTRFDTFKSTDLPAIEKELNKYKSIQSMN